jgi:hypothetical protein
MKAEKDGREIAEDRDFAQQVALKAAADICAQAEFASLDAARPETLSDAAKRFDTIMYFAQRALAALNRIR